MSSGVLMRKLFLMNGWLSHDMGSIINMPGFTSLTFMVLWLGFLFSGIFLCPFFQIVFSFLSYGLIGSIVLVIKCCFHWLSLDCFGVGW